MSTLNSYVIKFNIVVGNYEQEIKYIPISFTTLTLTT